jgi:UDP-N-acetylmuramoylalanine--D-glutamate ligase
MNIDHFKKICIVGCGKSGFSLCNLLLSLKKTVKLTELKKRECFNAGLIGRFETKGVIFEFDGHSDNFIKDCNLVILSPGVDALKSPAVKFANIAGIPCAGEIEFCFWLTQAKFIAITGTNGKTTTTFLTYRVLREKRRRVFLGGNIGIPVSSFILNTRKADLIVLEVSSFQLESIIKFKPFVAALLNIEPNHLDRHANFKEYFETKMNIFKNQDKNDWAVLNENINFLSDIRKRLQAKVVLFSSEFPNENYSCVYKIAKIFGAAKLDCEKIFFSFKGIPHRLQTVRKVKGITFINDSKSTNPSSTIWALKNTKGSLVLIAGGKDKGVDYSCIRPYLGSVRKINLFGQAAQKIKDSLVAGIKVEIYPSLQEVVRSSFEQANAGDTVLLSPMCSSFDMFSNYMERGRKFIEIVNSL